MRFKPVFIQSGAAILALPFDYVLETLCFIIDGFIYLWYTSVLHIHDAFDGYADCGDGVLFIYERPVFVKWI